MSSITKDITDFNQRSLKKFKKLYTPSEKKKIEKNLTKIFPKSFLSNPVCIRNITANIGGKGGETNIRKDI